MKKDRQQRTELHYAAVDGDVKKIQALLAGGADPSQPDRAGLTPLHFAAQSWSEDAVRALLEAGAKVDAQDENGNTPLHRAVFESRGRGECIQLLRAAGADPRLENHHKISPVGLARTIANFDVRRWFDDVPADDSAE